MAHNSVKSNARIRPNFHEDEPCFIPQNSVKSVSKVECYGCSEAEWTIKNWNARHKIVVTAKASCHIKIGNPEVELRFFLRPKENIMSLADRAFISKWYSLWAAVLTPHQNLKSGAINLTAHVRANDQLLLTKDGAIDINTSKGEMVEVIDRFLSLDSCCLNSSGRFTEISDSSFTYARCEAGKVDITITIKAELFRLIE